MKRQLFLHIGSHRTATSSIQAFMQANFETLVERGCLYPFRIRRHFKLINALFDGHRTAEEVAEDLSRRADNKSGGIDRIVLSDEDICMRQDLGPLQKLTEHFDVRILYSLRRQDLWLESWYFQNIKWQWNPRLSHIPFEEFLALREDFHWIRYDEYVRRLEEGFGAENIRLTVFEKGQMPGGALRTFCRNIGYDNLEGFAQTPRYNSSMSAEMIEFMRHLPLDLLDDPVREKFRRSLEEIDRQILGHTSRQSERLIPPELRREVLAEYEPGNQALAQRYFDRDALFLDPLPGEDDPLARLEIPAASVDLIQRFVAPLILQLVNNGTVSAGPKQ